MVWVGTRLPCDNTLLALKRVLSLHDSCQSKVRFMIDISVKHLKEFVGTRQVESCFLKCRNNVSSKVKFRIKTLNVECFLEGVTSFSPSRR